MIYQVPEYDAAAPILVIDIGNSTVSLATVTDGALGPPVHVSVDDEAAFTQAHEAHVEAMATDAPAACVLASVVPEALARVRRYLMNLHRLEPLVVGDHIALPMDVAVADSAAMGTDRVCAAVAVYDQIESSCIVIDLGSAVTVDLIDESGTLRGGAILPGLRMQLRALHEFTAQLPQVEPTVPDAPVGGNTIEAMQTGVCRGVIGAVRALVEAYAGELGAWPQVVATGGDVELLAPHCDFVDTFVPNLTLRGIAIAYRKHMANPGF